MGLPQNWGDWAAFVAVSATMIGAIGWIGRMLHRDITSRIMSLQTHTSTQIASCLSQLDAIEAWQADMKDDHLPRTYARKDAVELQLRGLEVGQTRLESSMKEVKIDMVQAVNEVKKDNRETIHAFRNDLIKLLRPLQRFPRRHDDPLDTDFSG